MIVPFSPDHLGRIAHALDPAFDLATFTAAAKRYTGPAYTLEADGQVIGCSGVELYWQGVGEAWALFTPAIFKMPRLVCRAARDGLDRIMAEHRLHRVQATVLRGNARACRWIEWLGFEFEGFMPKYGPDGQDFIRFAKVM